MPGRQVDKQAWHATYTLITLSRCSKLVYIIMFRISRYALAHSFVHKHRFLNEILHQFISTNFEHLLNKYIYIL